jgi:hypothetical protein
MGLEAMRPSFFLSSKYFPVNIWGEYMISPNLRLSTWKNFQFYLKLDQVIHRLDFIMQVFGILLSVAIFNFISVILGGNVNSYLEGYGGDYFPSC